VKPTMLSIIKGGVSYCIANDARLLPGSQGTMAAKTKSRASWQTAKRQPFANRIPSRDIGRPLDHPDRFGQRCDLPLENLMVRNWTRCRSANPILAPRSRLCFDIVSCGFPR